MSERSELCASLEDMFTCQTDHFSATLMFYLPANVASGNTTLVSTLFDVLSLSTAWWTGNCQEQCFSAHRGPGGKRASSDIHHEDEICKFWGLQGACGA